MVKITLKYENGKVDISQEGRSESTNKEEYIIGGLSDSFKRYILDIKSVYEKHMKMLDKNPKSVPVGKLEIELQLEIRNKPNN